MSDWKLRVFEPESKERRIPLREDLTIGRDPQCGCVLSDPRVSGRHARILAVEKTFMLEDLGSRNGTRVAGGPILKEGEQFTISAGDEFTVGNTRMQVMRVDQALAETASDLRVTPVQVEEGVPEAKTPAPRSPTPVPKTSVDLKYEAGQVVEEEPTPPATPAAEPEAVPAPKPIARAKKAPVPAPAPKADAAPQAEGKPEAAPAESAPAKAVVEQPDKKVPAKAAPMPASIPSPEEPGLGGPNDPISGEDFAGMTIAAGGAGELSEVAVQARLDAVGARLIIISSALGGAHSIKQKSYLIGRSAEAKPDLILADDSVSSRHGRITFKERRFYLEDLGSTNHTFMGDEQLAPRAPRELRSDTRLRFASLEAVFLADLDHNANPIPPSRYSAALDYLVHHKSITSKQRQDAEREAGGGHVGQVLLMRGVLSGTDWETAIQRGDLIASISPKRRGGVGGSGNRSILWVGIAIVVLALAAFLVFGADFFSAG